MLYGWGTDPDIWSGAAGEDLGDYERWLTEYAIWEAIAGQDGNGTGQDDTPG